jgi:tRNA A37 threonylcarbamoyladenosine modification protein TsaB
VLDEAIAGAACRLEDIDAVAVTHGPGLAGALLVGLNFAKALATPYRARWWRSTTWRAISTPPGWSARESRAFLCWR